MSKVECGFDSSRELILLGPTLKVRIGFDPNYRPGGRLQLPENEYNALIDTGAFESCIDSELASTLELPVVDRMGIAGVTGPGSVNAHLAQIAVPALNWIVYGRFAGVHLHAGGQSHSALLGRLFLQSMSMIYDGETGSVILSRNSPTIPGVVSRK